MAHGRIIVHTHTFLDPISSHSPGFHSDSNSFDMANGQRPQTSLPPRHRSTIQHRILSYPENGDELCERVFGFTPKPEQRMVTEHIGRGEDCILIAGCGWGKTLAYFLPLVLWEDRTILIISPLVALMEEQHRKLEAVKISSIPIYSGRQVPL